MLYVIVMLLISGCLEYNFDKNGPLPNPGETGQDTELQDTGVIVGDCSQFSSPSVPVPALDESCLQAPDPGAFDPVLEWRTPLDPSYVDNPTYQRSSRRR